MLVGGRGARVEARFRVKGRRVRPRGLDLTPSRDVPSCVATGQSVLLACGSFWQMT